MWSLELISVVYVSILSLVLNWPQLHLNSMINKWLSNGYSTYYLEERYLRYVDDWKFTKLHLSRKTIILIFSYKLKTFKVDGMDVMDGPRITQLSSHGRHLENENDPHHIDNTSDFEVEYPGSSSWHSDSGASERSPLFGDHSARGGSPSLRDKRSPKDHYNLVWIVFYMLGMTTLLPWNFFIAVNDYWNYKVQEEKGSGMLCNFAPYPYFSYMGVVLTQQIFKRYD